MHYLHNVPLALLALLAPLPATAQEGGAVDAVPLRQLRTPAVELREPFWRVTELRPLASGGALVAGARPSDVTNPGQIAHLRLYAVDFTAGTLRAVGTQGRNPGDYTNTGPLLPAPGDTTWMTDAVFVRAFVIGPAGEAVGNAPLPSHVIPREGEGNVYLNFVRTDTTGNFFDVRVAPSPESNTTYRDSVVLRHRGSLLRPASDTIAWLYRTKQRTPSTGFAGFTALPYSTRDQWAVAPGGEVLVVRADEYRVDRVWPPQAASRGAPIPHERRAVTPGDRAAYIAEMRKNAEDLRTAGIPRQDPGPELERATWPAFKPVFTGEVAIAPDRVWVPITPASAADPVVYDLVAFDGTLREKVAMPPATTVVGFGPGFVFTLRQDGDLLHLARWAWPPGE